MSCYNYLVLPSDNITDTWVVFKLEVKNKSLKVFYKDKFIQNYR